MRAALGESQACPGYEVSNNLETRTWLGLPSVIQFEPGLTLDGSRGEPVDQMALQKAEQHRHRDRAQNDAGR